jgi:hypothetical protein
MLMMGRATILGEFSHVDRWFTSGSLLKFAKLSFDPLFSAVQVVY